MSVYIVSYDLRQPGRNYEPLWARLRQWQAVRALESLWVVSTTATAVQLRDDLLNYVDANDGVLVGRLTGETAWRLLQGQSDKFLKAQFATA